MLIYHLFAPFLPLLYILRAMTYIYFVQAGPNGPIKIGSSTVPRYRLMTLQVYHYETLTLLGFIEHSEDREHQLHSLAERFRIRGEWFTPGKELIAFIKHLLDDYARSTGPEIVEIKKLSKYHRRNYVPPPPSDLSSALGTTTDPELPTAKARIVAALRETHGNISKAAKLLGYSRRTLQNRMQELGIPRGRAGRPRKQPLRPSGG